MTKHENMPKSGQEYLKIKQKTCLSPVGKDDFYFFARFSLDIVEMPAHVPLWP